MERDLTVADQASSKIILEWGGECWSEYCFAHYSNNSFLLYIYFYQCEIRHVLCYHVGFVAVPVRLTSVVLLTAGGQ